MPHHATMIAATAGAAGAVLARGVLRRLLLAKLRSDLAALNGGDYRPLLAGFSDDAVLTFPGGTHRWAGEHRGKSEIEEFLHSFVLAGLHGELHSIWLGGWPWQLTAAVRFDDHAEDPDGTRVYSNQAVLLVTTRWGKIIRQEDFFADTGRIEAFDRHLTTRAKGHQPG
jgi:ketosteroid isomerase-like protein